MEEFLKESRSSADMAVALIIRRPGNRICFVPKRGKHTIPTEHFDPEKGDVTLFDSASRCVHEEFGVDSNDFCIEESLGTFISQKPNGKKIIFEVYLCSVLQKTAERMHFSEKGESGQRWETLLRAEEKLFLDALALDGLQKLVQRSKLFFLPSRLIQMFVGKKRRVKCLKRKNFPKVENEQFYQ